MKKNRILSIGTCLFLVLFFPALSGATIIIASGLVGGSGDVENVLFNGTGTIAGPALTVTGRTNTSNLIVEFTGTENLVTPSSGQARIEGTDGAFTELSFRLQNPALGFAKVQFNLDADSDGSVTLAFEDQFGTLFQNNFLLDANGENFFTAYSNDNQVMVNASILSTVDLVAISDMAQVRIGPTATGSGPSTVPLPPSLLLLGTGILGLAGFGRKKHH